MSTNIPRIAREAIELSEKATPAPWKLWGSEVRADPKGTSDLKDSVLICDPVMTTDPENGRLRCPDSYFIAHAGTHYGTLARYVEDTAAIVEAAVNLDRVREMMATAEGDDFMDALAESSLRQVALDDAVRAYRAKGAT